MGIEEFKLHPNAGSVSIAFDPSIIRADQVVRHLDLALAKAPVRRKKSSPNLELRVATGSLALSTAATFFAPLLLPIGAALMLYTALPSFRRAWRVFKNERRLCVDVLDSMIFMACLFTAKREFIAQRQYDGQSVVYFGNWIREAEAAEKADLAINVCEGESGVQANVPIVFLNPDLAKCRLLLSLGVARMSALRSTQATVTVPNIAAILAAIYLNTPVLISVLLTTLGTAVSYRHWTRILRSLE
jgi:hypothetical protein